MSAGGLEGRDAIHRVLDFRASHPYTGLGDAPPAVTRALDSLARMTDWRSPAARRPTPKAPARKAPARRRLKSRPVPAWAQDLVAQVCDEAGRQPPRHVTWWRRSDPWSSGHTSKGEGRIHVTAGTDERDQRLVVLHELAHWLSPPGHHHSRHFWQLTWTLYGEHMGEALPFAVARECAMWKKARAYCPYPIPEELP